MRALSSNGRFLKAGRNPRFSRGKPWDSGLLLTRGRTYILQYDKHIFFLQKSSPKITVVCLHNLTCNHENTLKFKSSKYIVLLIVFPGGNFPGEISLFYGLAAVEKLGYIMCILEKE
jgi:hypothetical protein